jgi:hypothetical protein
MKSMYTNIDTDTGIAAIQNFLYTNKNNIPTDFPSDIFFQILELIMRNTIFSLPTLSGCNCQGLQWVLQ